MDINAASPVAATPADLPARQAGKSDAEVLSSDFETFLRMLTTQMQNQDPLNPLQATDFAAQLATFSGVEQQVRTNDLLLKLSASMELAGLGDAARWVGMEARTDAPVLFEGAPVTLILPSVPSANVAELVVLNASGAELARLPADPAGGAASWAGTAADGSPMPPGIYRFRIEASAGDSPLGAGPVQSYAPVTEVRLRDGEAVVVLPGGIEVPAASISAIRAPAG